MGTETDDLICMMTFDTATLALSKLETSSFNIRKQLYKLEKLSKN